jgi:hypothetical protein
MKFIAYGHKLHTHTHSYIHNAFLKAAKYKGYDTFWYDSSDVLNYDELNGAIFLTEGQVDDKIPLIGTAYYILHNCNLLKYETIPKDRILQIQFLRNDDKYKPNIKKINEFSYLSIENGFKTLYIPWATNLLTHEIQQNITNLPHTLSNISNNEVYFIGTYVPPWDKLEQCLTKKKISFIKNGMYTNGKSPNDSQSEMLMKRSKICPVLNNIPFQKQVGYIPCRAFKQLSYGRMIGTNSIDVYNFFKKQIIYDDDVERLVEKLLSFENKYNVQQKVKYIEPIMRFIQENHTYTARIEEIERILYFK